MHQDSWIRIQDQLFAITWVKCLQLTDTMIDPFWDVQKYNAASLKFRQVFCNRSFFASIVKVLWNIHLRSKKMFSINKDFHEVSLVFRKFVFHIAVGIEKSNILNTLSQFWFWYQLIRPHNDSSTTLLRNNHYLR